MIVQEVVVLREEASTKDPPFELLEKLQWFAALHLLVEEEAIHLGRASTKDPPTELLGKFQKFAALHLIAAEEAIHSVRASTKDPPPELPVEILHSLSKQHHQRTESCQVGVVTEYQELRMGNFLASLPSPLCSNWLQQG